MYFLKFINYYLKITKNNPFFVVTLIISSFLMLFFELLVLYYFFNMIMPWYFSFMLNWFNMMILLFINCYFKFDFKLLLVNQNFDKGFMKFYKVHPLYNFLETYSPFFSGFYFLFYIILVNIILYVPNMVLILLVFIYSLYFFIYMLLDIVVYIQVSYKAWKANAFNMYNSPPDMVKLIQNFCCMGSGVFTKCLKIGTVVIGGLGSMHAAHSVIWPDDLTPIQQAGKAFQKKYDYPSKLEDLSDNPLDTNYPDKFNDLSNENEKLKHQMDFEVLQNKNLRNDYEKILRENERLKLDKKTLKSLLKDFNNKD